jgi:hypothetical protein
MGVLLRLERRSFEREMWKLFSYAVMSRTNALFPLRGMRRLQASNVCKNFTDAIVSDISQEGYERLQEINVGAKLTDTIVSNTSLR